MDVETLTKSLLIGNMLLLSYIFLIIIPSVNAECQEFQDLVLLSSLYNYSNVSVDYSTWELAQSCPGPDCYLNRINVYIRSITPDPANISGYFQIADPQRNDCVQPIQSSYNRYLAGLSTWQSDEVSYQWECGGSYNLNTCDMTFDNPYNQSCYGIKGVADPNILLDVLQVNYTWCWKSNETNDITISNNSTKSAKPLLLIGTGILIFIIVLIGRMKRP